MATVAIPLLVMVLGGFVYSAASGGKVVEMGRLAYFAGLLGVVYQLASHTIHF